MDYSQIYSALKDQFPNLEIHKDHLLAPYTTINIGGPADIFIHTKSSEELLNVLKYLSEAINFSAQSDREGMSPKVVSTAKISLPSKLTILGNGSNALISDNGIRGIVIKTTSQNIQILGKNNTDSTTGLKTINSQRTENDPGKYLNFNNLDYDESDKPRIIVKVDAGTSLPTTISNLINQGITGLQWFAYIPGTIGGAVYCNIHGGKYHISDYINNVEVFDLNTGKVINFDKDDIDWAYDSSSFQNHPHLIILSVTLNLFLGDVDRARAVVTEWIRQKSAVQPMNSLGSVFKNPKPEDCIPIWGEQKSAGWIIDQGLKWKSHSVGDAQISPQHANFIINTGKATSQNYLNLVQSIQTEVEKYFGLKLETEINQLGDF